MESTYRAVLHKGKLRWMGRQPDIDPDRMIEVKVVISDEEVYAPRFNEEAVNSLREIAIRGGIPSIKDPVAWQREIRKDRPLPGRD